MTYSIGSYGSREWDEEYRRVAVAVRPGELHVTHGDEVMAATVGCQVLLCARDPRSGVSGMVHVGAIGDSLLMKQVYSLFSALQYHREVLEVALIGGARAVSSLHDEGVAFIAHARGLLHRSGVECRFEDVGGIHPRHVRFLTRDGEIRIEHLPGPASGETPRWREPVSGTAPHALQER